VERGIQLTVIPLGKMNEAHKLSRMADRFLPVASASQLESTLATAVSIESSGDGQAISEDFATVAGLPDEVAAAWIREVTAPKGNWRFGHKPEPPKPAPAPAAASDATTSPTARRDQNDPHSSTGGCSSSGSGPSSLVGALLALTAIARRSRRP
ncbi:MAG: hypothetical protein EBR15_08300, partial [Gammaproteobacteria bacterium]|nr:hypothetical protein [Gammaproteobacteria bacterium]